MIHRDLEKNILDACFKGKIILLLGARQVGKTTLLKEILSKIDVSHVWLNVDEADILQAFETATTSTQLLHLIGKKNRLVVMDEAQQISDTAYAI